MPKRLLRSVIEYDKEVSQENLVRNFQLLRKAVEAGQLDWGRPEDERIYKYVLGFFSQFFEIPSAQTVLDYFESSKHLEEIERVKDIRVEKPYARTNFVHLLRTQQEEQGKIKAVALIKETHEILMRGIEDKDNKGEKIKGLEAAISHFNKKSQELRVTDTNVRVHGDIRTDAQEMIDEYNLAEMDRGKAIGSLCGINEVDDICRGAKKGELWIHAAYPGELKTSFACNWCYNAVTRYKTNVVYVSFEMKYEQIRRNIYTIHTTNTRFANRGFKPLDYRAIRDGTLTQEEKDFYQNVVIRDFDSNPTYTHFELVCPDRDWNMDDIRAQLELLHKEFEVGLVVLDHGQWIEPRKARKNKDYTIELNSVVNDSKRLALTFDHNAGVPVLMLFQINRNGKDDADKNDGIYKLKALTYANACCSAGTLIQTKGALLPIESVRPGTEVWSSTGWQKVLSNFDNGVRDVVVVSTDRGTKIVVTPDHRFRTITESGLEWVEARHLSKESYVLGASNSYTMSDKSEPKLPVLKFQKWERSIRVPKAVTPELAYLLGAYIGDGISQEEGVGYVGNLLETKVKAKISAYFFVAFGKRLLRYKRKASGVFILAKGSGALARWFRAIGSDRGTDGVPTCILQSSSQCQLSFLKGFWDTDGHVNTQGNISIGQEVAKRGTLEHVQLMLLGFGIDSAIHPKIAKLNGKEYPQEVLTIRSRRGRKLFASLIGFTEPHKQNRLKRFVKKYAGSDRRASLEEWPVADIYRRLLLRYGWFTRKGTEQIKAYNLFVGKKRPLQLRSIADQLYGNHDGNNTRRAYSLMQTMVRKGFLKHSSRGVYTGSIERERFYFPRKCNIALSKIERRGYPLVSRGAIEDALITLSQNGVLGDPDAELLSRLLATVIPQKVISVVPAGEAHVYDLEVTGDHEFAAGGLLVHNCEKTADVITSTYLNEEMRNAGLTKFCNLKNRDNPLFEPFQAHVNFVSRRILSPKRMEPQGFVVEEFDSYLQSMQVQL